MQWQPIETAPAHGPDEDSDRVLVFVANGGSNGHGAVVFGHIYRSKSGNHPRADGHSGAGWKITHWMPVPEFPTN